MNNILLLIFVIIPIIVGIWVMVLIFKDMNKYLEEVEKKHD